MDERRQLEKVVNDRARKVRIRGNQVIVPLKFDEDGEIATPDHLTVKRLSLKDLRFLKLWKANGWDIEKSCREAQIDGSKVKVLVRKLSCFRDEDAKVKALAEIPTPDWIKSKHVENVYSNKLEDSQQKSLAELAKIEGAYKQQSVQTQVNVFNLPVLPPEKEAELKKVFDTIAVDGEQRVA